MPSEVTEMLKTSYVSRAGVPFEVTLSKKHLTAAHNYWLYFFVARNEEHGNLGFKLLATKQAFAQEQLADYLAATLGVDEVTSRLDEADSGGKAISAPLLTEGWALL